jgi:uncharacterized repeat protein (TIGR01451 family)
MPVFKARIAALVLAMGTISAVGVAGAPAASAAPGTPGVPQAPTVVYTEGFENGTGTTPVVLTDYTGGAPLAETYAADAPWLVGCNGNILEFTTPDSDLGNSNCATLAGFSYVRQLAYVLGAHAGAAQPAENHAVTAYTDNDPGDSKIEIATNGDIPLASAAGRFLTFSVDAAALNCDRAAPEYQFSLTNGADVTPVGAPVDACTSTNTEVAPTVGNSGSQPFKVDTYASGSAVLFTGATAGIQMVNATGSGTGNDAAFDNLRLLDATPQLDKSFEPTSLPAGQAATLTFTITNTTDLEAKDGWSFTDQLPAGLKVAAPGGSSDCTGVAMTAAAGATSIHATGDLSAGTASCAVTVAVTAQEGGDYTNGAANVTSVGLNDPADATVTFTGSAITTPPDSGSSSGASPSALAFTGTAPVLPGALGAMLLLVSGAVLLLVRNTRRRARAGIRG